MALLNRFGLIIFSPAGAEAGDLLGLPDNSASVPASASVILVPGETYSFYLPIAVTLNSLSIDLFSDAGRVSVIGGVGSLLRVDLLPGIYHYLATVTVPVSTLPEVYYRFRIVTMTGSVYSNRVWLRKSGYKDSSALFSYRNRSAIGPIAYDLPALATFRNVLRLKCTTELAQTESELEEYEQITTGVKVPVSLRSHLAIPVICPNTDAIGHEGWRSLCLHKDILMNGRAVSIKTGYQEGEGEGQGISNGSFQVWDSMFSVVNRC